MNLPLNTDLTGKVAVVTGAGGVLCAMFSRALAQSVPGSPINYPNGAPEFKRY